MVTKVNNRIANSNPTRPGISKALNFMCTKEWGSTTAFHDSLDLVSMSETLIKVLKGTQCGGRWDRVLF